MRHHTPKKHKQPTFRFHFAGLGNDICSSMVDAHRSFSVSLSPSEICVLTLQFANHELHAVTVTLYRNVLQAFAHLQAIITIKHVTMKSDKRCLIIACTDYCCYIGNYTKKCVGVGFL